MPDRGERSLDGVRMCAAVTDAHGVVNRDTTLVFTEREGLISAHYSGGRIRHGFLLGTHDGARLTFRYMQVDVEGRLDAGHSTGELTELAGGRLRLTERFQWDTRSESGTNVFEELA